MEPELEKYYENFFDLFAQVGWKQFIDELKQNAAVMNSVEATKDANDLYFRKGQLNVLAFVINLEDSIRNSFEELTESKDD